MEQRQKVRQCGGCHFFRVGDHEGGCRLDPKTPYLVAATTAACPKYKEAVPYTVTVREQREVKRGAETRMRWLIVTRDHQHTLSEAVDKAFDTLCQNAGFAVTIMRRR